MLMILEFADYKKMHNFYLKFVMKILMVSISFLTGMSMQVFKNNVAKENYFFYIFNLIFII